MEKENPYETKSGKVEILRGVVDDAEGIQALVSEASKGMYKLCGWTEKEIEDHFNPEITKGGADKTREAIAAFTEANILFVAKDSSDEIIGCCFAEKQEDINKIEAIYVLPDFQGLGLSDKLFDDTYKLLNLDNDTFLDVFSLNLKAINFYKRLGFSETNNRHFDKKYTGSTGAMLEITEMMLPGKKPRV
jgi:ribosomal protein S18 acetylase RimI-like enzyme